MLVHHMIHSMACGIPGLGAVPECNTGNPQRYVYFLELAIAYGVLLGCTFEAANSLVSIDGCFSNPLNRFSLAGTVINSDHRTTQLSRP